MTKMYLQSFLTFTRNEVRGTHLVFFKRGYFKVSYLILRMVGLLGEKFTFSTPLGQPDFQESQTNSNSINFELCFYSKYSRSYKVL